MAKPMPLEKRERVKQLYLEGRKIREITELTGVKPGQITRIIDKYGLPHRYLPRKSSKVEIRDWKKFCPKCGSVNTKAMTECWNCGTDIRTKAQILLPKCDEMFSYLPYLPRGFVDNALEIMREIREYLKEQ